MSDDQSAKSLRSLEARWNDPILDIPPSGDLIGQALHSFKHQADQHRREAWPETASSSSERRVPPSARSTEPSATPPLTIWAPPPSRRLSSVPRSTARRWTR